MRVCRAEVVLGNVKTIIDVTVNPGGSSIHPLACDRQVQKLTKSGNNVHIGVIW